MCNSCRAKEFTSKTIKKDPRKKPEAEMQYHPEWGRNWSNSVGGAHKSTRKRKLEKLDDEKGRNREKLSQN